MNTDDALKWAFESDWGTDWGKDCRAMVQLGEEVNRLIQLNVSTQKHADCLLDKLHVAEAERDRYKAGLQWCHDNYPAIRNAEDVHFGGMSITEMFKKCICDPSKGIRCAYHAGADI